MGRPKGSKNKTTRATKTQKTPVKKDETLLQEYHRNKKTNISGKRNRNYKTHVEPYLEDIKELVMKGATNKEIIAMIGCSMNSHYKWRKEHEEYDKIFTDDHIKNKLRDELFESIFDRAKGKWIDEEKITYVGKDEVEKVVTKKFIFSDKSAEMYIKNVLGGKGSETEINITLVNDGLDITAQIGTEDDEGDFEISR